MRVRIASNLGPRTRFTQALAERTLAGLGRLVGGAQKRKRRTLCCGVAHRRGAWLMGAQELPKASGQWCLFWKESHDLTFLSLSHHWEIISTWRGSFRLIESKCWQQCMDRLNPIHIPTCCSCRSSIMGLPCLGEAAAIWDLHGFALK